jgi:hypothetical protein
MISSRNESDSLEPSQSHCASSLHGILPRSLKDGREAWILIHVEIQNQRDPGFAERMFVYNGENDAIRQ